MRTKYLQRNTRVPSCSFVRESIKEIQIACVLRIVPKIFPGIPCDPQFQSHLPSHLHIAIKEAEDGEPGSMEYWRDHPGHLAVLAISLETPVKSDWIKTGSKCLS